MDIGFVWDEDKYRQVVAHHDMRFYEVVSAFDDPNGDEILDPAGHADRWMWVGQAVQGRVLMVIYAEDELPLYRIITAFDAEGEWLDAYTQGHRV